MPTWVVENTLIAAVLALLVALACRLWRVPPVVRHGLWLVVFIRLVSPPIFWLGLRFPPIRLDWQYKARVAESVTRTATKTSDDPNKPATAAELSFPCDANVRASVDEQNPAAADVCLAPQTPAESFGLDTGRARRVDASPTGSIGGESALHVGPIAGEQSDLSAAGRTDAEPLDVATRRPPTIELKAGGADLPALSPEMIIRNALFAGTLGIFVLLGIRLVRLGRLLRCARPAPPTLAALVIDLAERLSMRPPVVKYSSLIRSPIVCALGRPVLLWPESRLEGLSAVAREAVIVHELAHLARRDHWIGWLELLAECAWWWNPLFWYVRRQLHENAELACDAWVTATLPEGRSAYARALVDLAERGSLEPRPAAALGIGVGSRKLFERRLVMIMGETVRYRLGAIGLASIGLLVLASLPGCSAGQASEQPAGVAAAAFGPADSEIPVGSPATEPATAQSIGEPQGSIEAVSPAAEPGSSPSQSPLNILPAIESIGSPGRPANQATASEPGASNEDRLKRLEDRFDALLAEIRELKGSPAHVTGRRTTESSSAPAHSTRTQTARDELKKGSAMGMQGSGGMMMRGMGTMSSMASNMRRRGLDDEPVVEEVALTRSTYKLPHERAEALAAFIKSNLSDEIEVRVKENSLQVTATADDQAAIGQFIRLLQSRGAPFGEQTKRRESIKPDSLDEAPQKR
jgi:beta-lactamase regulating signal transducer with metallopeptidase domain